MPVPSSFPATTGRRTPRAGSQPGAPRRPPRTRPPPPRHPAPQPPPPCPPEPGIASSVPPRHSGTARAGGPAHPCRAHPLVPAPRQSRLCKRRITGAFRCARAGCRFSPHGRRQTEAIFTRAPGTPPRRAGPDQRATSAVADSRSAGQRRAGMMKARTSPRSSPSGPMTTSTVATAGCDRVTGTDSHRDDATAGRCPTTASGRRRSSLPIICSRLSAQLHELTDTECQLCAVACFDVSRRRAAPNESLPVRQLPRREQGRARRPAIRRTAWGGGSCGRPRSVTIAG